MIGFHRIWSRESSEPNRLGNPNAVSPKGAAGPMQPMPAYDAHLKQTAWLSILNSGKLKSRRALF